MPALNINFTEAELARIRDRAQSKRVSMRTLVHDTVLDCTAQSSEDDRILAAYARIKSLSEDILAWLAER